MRNAESKRFRDGQGAAPEGTPGPAIVSGTPPPARSGSDSAPIPEGMNSCEGSDCINYDLPFGFAAKGKRSELPTMNILIKKDEIGWIVSVTGPDVNLPSTWTGGSAKEAIDEAVKASGRKGNEAVHVAERLRLQLRGGHRAEISLPAPVAAKG